MLDQLARVDMSIYFQILVFILFLAALIRLHWKMGAFLQIVWSSVKYFVLLLVFIYLFLNWASDVNPTLRSSSLLIMTIINLYMLWQTILAGFELPYRRALQSCVDGVCTATDLDLAFASGKRYYKFRYLWASLSTGITPWRFLRLIAAERTRDDLHRVFVNLDPKASIFGSNLFYHFLIKKLAADKAVPEAKRAELRRDIEALTREPWLEERTSDFLDHLLAAPEGLLDAGLKDSLKAEGKLA